ncbi:unnamed protein product [Amoebophrya sp. A120]|nr:unnamed protein product [Amoebophrya sp. A120]|eukprot:GSA120T00006584001.1
MSFFIALYETATASPRRTRWASFLVGLWGAFWVFIMEKSRSRSKRGPVVVPSSLKNIVTPPAAESERNQDAAQLHPRSRKNVPDDKWASPNGGFLGSSPFDGVAAPYTDNEMQDWKVGQRKTETRKADSTSFLAAGGTKSNSKEKRVSSSARVASSSSMRRGEFSGMGG